MTMAMSSVLVYPRLPLRRETNYTMNANDLDWCESVVMVVMFDVGGGEIKRARGRSETLDVTLLLKGERRKGNGGSW